MKKQISLLAIAILILFSLVGCGQKAPGNQVSSGGNGGGTTQGEEINLLLVSHTFVDALKPLIPEFEKETGIKVKYEVLAEGPAFEKLLADLSSNTGIYDVFMTSPINNWQYISGGWVEPLDDYIADKSKTPDSWDFNDFVPGIVNSGRWTGEPLKGVGEGKLYALPINYESYNLAYRPSILKKYNLEVPKTYEDLGKMVTELSKLNMTDENGQKIYPIVTRFDKYWDLTYLTLGTMLQTYGVHLIDDNGEVVIDSPESIEATKLFVDMIKQGSPEGAGLFTWYEALQGFASGQYLFSLNEADGFASTYENKDQSQVSDDVGYALTPEGPDGSRSASIWVWSLGMNSASKHKDAAWKFLQWTTSREVMIKTHLAGNMNPVRASAWEDPEVAAMVQSWGEKEGQYLSIVQEMSKVAGLRLPAHPEITRFLDIWAEAVQKAYYGQETVENALKDAADQIRRSL
ncbi:ABC transporter substrate-binding protein [Paenibacillus woosongensis]|uniref:Extracellular solute-binding protein n=1 Tax=Paenibacillus woosongensis TaxID=307580 RepID=A0A7X3CMW6_9BACL|nr:sugar ABC transporter substrate-binding protein [Paenibacillus woosongensis]MUG44385.1 extracellular solute-binding protein [Paenibacillus woosongensis]